MNTKFHTILTTILTMTLSSCVQTEQYTGSISESLTCIGDAIMKGTADAGKTATDFITGEYKDQPAPYSNVLITNSQELRQMQSTLQSLSYNPKGIDGKWGPGSKRALKQYQLDHNLQADGIPTYGIYDTLTSKNPYATSFVTPPKRMRTTKDINQLFSERFVNGEQLLTELRAIQKTANEADRNRAFSSLVGTINQAQANPFSIKNINLDSLVGIVTKASLSHATTTINHTALDKFMEVMLDDRTIMAKETIELPPPKGLTNDQKQRVLYIAAFVIGARVANQVADEAFETLQTLENEYANLLVRRQKLAETLADVVARRNEAAVLKDELRLRQRTAELRQYLSDEDIQFIDEFGSDHSLHEFASDFAMQNLAIKFLKGQNPELYKNYRVEVDGLVGRTRVAVKTAGGAIAFGGLVTSFIHEVTHFGNIRSTDALVNVLPLGGKFISAAAPLAVKVAKNSMHGIVLGSSSLAGKLVGLGPKRFRVTSAGGTRTDVREASNVFDSLENSPEHDKLFKDALFSNNGNGFLLSIYRSDPDTTGRMLDTAIPKKVRKKFGIEVMHAPETQDYSFVNELTSRDKQNRNRLVKNVLASDQRRHATIPIVGEAQQLVTENCSYWGDTQLTRLILANYDGSIEYAQMQIGTMSIRLIPSMTAVYEYESYMDDVRTQIAAR